MRSILETKRLVLREFHLSDARHLWALNADPAVIRYTGDLPFSSREAAGAFLQAYDAYRQTGYGRWAVLLKPKLEFIGWCGLKTGEEGLTDIGFRFLKSHWNNGYATEAARACLRYGFDHLQLEEIIGRAACANTASIRVLEKLNMKFWKRTFCKGLGDTLIYRIGKAAYKKTNHISYVT